MGKALISFCTLFIFFQSNGQQTTNQNSLSDWNAVTGTIEEKEHMGRKALYLSRGLAYLPTSNFENGTIEVDIAPGNPGMGGIAFHIDKSFNYDEVYIRYVKSGGPDALQYCPVFNGEFSWQIYSEYQANPKFPINEWTHLKIMIENGRAAVFISNIDTAVLYIDSLRVPNKSGSVGIWCLTGTYFSNFRYSSSAEKVFTDFSKFHRKTINNPDAIKGWWISEPFDFSDEAVNRFDKKTNLSHKWQKANTEPDGLLNICRYATKKVWGKTRENSHDVVWLKYEWEENSAGIKPFSFDFTNRCYIFLNEAKIFSGNNSFFLKGSLYRGDIDKPMRGNTVYLPVKKGKNTIAIAVSGITNGWAYMAQFADGTTRKTAAF